MKIIFQEIKMHQWPTLEEQIKSAGIYYPRSYDIIYRIGYILQSIGATSLFLFLLLKTEGYFIPLIIFEVGIAISSIYLLVWKAEIKRFILIMTFSGIVFQAISIFLSTLIPFYEKIFFIGLGLTLTGGAGLVGKEAFCFRFNEGWALMIIYPLAVIPNLFGFSSFNYNLVISGVIAILHLSFLRRKLSQPLLKKCEGNVCGLPENIK